MPLLTLRFCNATNHLSKPHKEAPSTMRTSSARTAHRRTREVPVAADEVEFGSIARLEPDAIIEAPCSARPYLIQSWPFEQKHRREGLRFRKELECHFIISWSRRPAAVTVEGVDYTGFISAAMPRQFCRLPHPENRRSFLKSGRAGPISATLTVLDIIS